MSWYLKAKPTMSNKDFETRNRLIIKTAAGLSVPSHLKTGREQTK